MRKLTYVDKNGIQMCEEAHPNIGHLKLEQELSGKRSESDYLQGVHAHDQHELESHT